MLARRPAQSAAPASPLQRLRAFQKGAHRHSSSAQALRLAEHFNFNGDAPEAAAQAVVERALGSSAQLCNHDKPELHSAPLISEEQIVQIEGELKNGSSMQALQRFNAALRALPGTPEWRARLQHVLTEFCFNLESFNPAFTQVLLTVQRTIGHSDYVRRDEALKRLIVPLAGEYGMHNGEAQGKTHRQLFDSWVTSMGFPSASSLTQDGPEPTAGKLLFEQMTRDIGSNGGCAEGGPLTRTCYALGYNLAIEFMADYEKRWMLESFRALDGQLFAPQGHDVDWLFLEVHAEDEMEHAAIGHEAVRALVPSELASVVARAAHDHDRDFAAFYNAISAVLEGH